MSKLPPITPSDLRQWGACWSDRAIAAAFAGRASVPIAEALRYAGATAADRVWLGCQYLARHDRAKMVAFARRCADYAARADADAAADAAARYAAAAAAAARYAAAARAAAARYAARYAAARRAADDARYAACWAAAAAAAAARYADQAARYAARYAAAADAAADAAAAREAQIAWLLEAVS